MKNRLYTIASGLNFADRLAQWILTRYGEQPIALPEIMLLLPSRRACLALREAFLRATDGRPTLLPRMCPLGDVDEGGLFALQESAPQLLATPHPAFAQKRLFVLAQLVRAYQSNVHGRTERMDHAVYQAQSIAALLDAVEREGADLTDLASLAPEDFAQHWQMVTGFLSIIAEHWPAIAIERELTSHETWRSQQMLQLAEQWRKHPPTHPVIAAGTTGSVAATSELLKVIAGMEKGAVVLPGLDVTLSEEDAQQLAESHPQFGMCELLRQFGVAPQDVQSIGRESEAGAARRELLARALCPAEKLEMWRTTLPQAGEAVGGLQLLECAHEQEEAVAISLMLREALETKGKTAALVTHDRQLARRVVAEMARYGVQVDDSAGKPLADTPAVALLRLVLAMAEQQGAPVALLALLKHPYAHAGMERIACLEATRALERAVLRGICPTDGIAGMRAALLVQKNPPPVAFALLDAVQQSMGEFIALFARDSGEAFSVLLEAHVAAAASLAGEALWKGREAEALHEHLEQVCDAAEEAGIMEVAAYPAVFEALFVGKAVRPDYGMHPRLKILSPLEARMQSFDRIILGGLNEGNWPPQANGDPWLNRAMRAKVGLASNERQVGQAAHDFAMLAAAPEVMLTRAQKEGGSPTTPARWWVRLATLLEHHGLTGSVESGQYARWAAQLFTAEEVTPCARPAPAPPLAARPQTVAITQVEHWLLDPYRFYAANILRLRGLKEVDEDPSAADFGTLVHRALQLFAERYPQTLPPDAHDALLRIGRDVFAPYATGFPVVEAWWWPKFEQVAAWMIATEKALRPTMGRVWAEVSGMVELEGVTFTGRADRLETLNGGGLAIVDYKTGGTQSKQDTKIGNAPQLVLLALMAEQGKWEMDIAERQVQRLEYWLAGGTHAGEVRAVDAAKIHEYAAIARERLVALIQAYQNPHMAYSCFASGQERYNDFAHLSRVDEWL